MNQKWIISKKIWLLFLIITSSYGSSLAKMAYRPTHLVETSELINQLSQLERRTKMEEDQLLLLTIARDLVALKQVRISGQQRPVAKTYGSLKIVNIVNALEKQLSTGPEEFWKIQISGKSRLLIRREKSNLMSLLSEKSFLWAWIQNGLNQSIKAKTILDDLFEREYLRLMSLSRMPFRSYKNGPLFRLKLYSQALIILSSEAETQEVKEKLRKVKVHMSSIPQSNIMT